MKRYICVNCGQVFTGWGIGETCQKCGGKLELIVEKGEKNRKLSKKGFTLIELMVAVAILAFVVFGIFRAYSTGFMGMAVGRDITVATNYARGEMETIINKPFEILSTGETPPDYKEKFSISTTITNEVIGGVERNDLKRVITTVSWDNRKGENREVELEMLIYGYI